VLFEDINGTTKYRRSLITIEETMHEEDIDTCIQGNPESINISAKPN
jgi:hypothetical protein